MENNESERICVCCGRIIEENEEVYNFNEDIYCEECFDENIRHCDDCGELCHVDDTTLTADENIVCQDCLEDDYFFCEGCQGWHHIEDATEADGNYYCESCLDELFRCCEDCGEYFNPDREGICDHNGRYICESCADSYFFCEECQEYYHEDDAQTTDDFATVCCNCYEHIEEEQNGDFKIYNYHEFNNWTLYKNANEEKPPFYIGFELEVQPKDGDTSYQPDALKCVYDNLNAICAKDGSLGSGGFEIISHPQSFNFILEHKEQLKNTLNALISYGYTSHDNNNCGLHFHITRPKDAEVIDKLWYILETYKKEIILLSRRSGAQLSRWAHFLSDAQPDRKEELKALYFIKKTDKNFERYLALNNQNPKTIEFRFFKGTLKFETFMASLEFINNLVTLCSDGSVKINDIDWNKLCQGEYIRAYIDERDIHPTHKPNDLSMELLKKENMQKSLANKIVRLFMQYSRELLQANNIQKTNLKNAHQIYDTSISLRRYYNDLCNGFFEKFNMLQDNFNNFDSGNFIHFCDIILCYYSISNCNIREKICELFEKMKEIENGGVL